MAPHRARPLLSAFLLLSPPLLRVSHGVLVDPSASASNGLERHRVEMDLDVATLLQQDNVEMERTRIHQEDEAQSIFRDIWEAEALLAEREAERLLSGDIFQASSLPPTRQPLSGPPSPSPTVSPTATPTIDTSCLNGRTRQEVLFDELSLITNPDLLLDVSTPQGAAFDFMVNNDPLNPNVCTYPTIDQRYGLATFYFATTGSGWTDDTGWLTGAPECDGWFGVVCNDGVLASNLTLRQNTLIGTLPEEISTLFGMVQMLLSTNNLTSTLPLGFSNMTSLAVLDLEQNQLSGPPIPAQLLLLAPTLMQLLMSFNNFEREVIPPDVNLLTELTDLWLASNGMIGPIPTTIGELVNLKSLLLYENQLTGSLPSELGLLTALEDLRLFKNVFVRQLPEELYNLNQLTVLHIQENFFTGTVSTNIGNLNQLVDLRYDNNFFVQSLPNSIGQLTNLVTASFSMTTLQGVIPDVFTNFDALDTLDLSSAAFSGPIPATVFSNPMLRLLYLNENQLTGAIPASFSSPPLLQDLFLDNNLLSSVVPAIPANALTELQEFTLQRNSIGGVMPQSVCDLRATVLDVLSADCGGPTPEIECAFPACCTRCFQD